MDLVKGIKERRSIRKFQNKPVPHELLTEVGEIVDIPEGQTLAAIIPVGFPADGEPACPPRKDPDDLISFV